MHLEEIAQVFTLAGAGRPLREALDELCRLVERWLPEAYCSILLLEDGRWLCHNGSVRLPAEYIRQVDGLEIGPEAGSCGAAAWHKRRIIVSDIDSHPHWRSARDIARCFGLAACWSTPILSDDQSVLGTFAVYYREKREPTEAELHLIDQVTSTARLLIEFHRTEAELRQSRQMLHTILDSVPVRIFWKDRESRYLGANRLFLQDARLAHLDDLLGKTDFDLPLDPATATRYHADDRAIMESGQAKLDFEEPGRHADNTEAWFHTSKAPLIGVDGRIAGVLGAYSDITAQKQAEAQIRQLAYYDTLTGLPNRRLLLDRLGQALAMADRAGHKVIVLFVDLDRFKRINDSLGHVAGDACLRQVAHLLSAAVRQEDTIGRLGGDEFLVVLPDARHGQDAVRVANLIQQALARPLPVMGHEFRVGASIGISIFPDDGHDAETLIKNADTAMYRAKENDRDGYQFYTADLNAPVLTALETEAALRDALERDELLLYYQPRIELASGRLTGLEALVRWQRPGIGLLPPAEFIPLAEDRRLIGQLDEWVLREACRQNSAWRQAGLAIVPVAVNLSARQIPMRGLPAAIAAILAETGLEPRELELEMSGEALLADNGFLPRLLRNLRAQGVRCGIDDFGAGSFNLRRLRDLPVHQLSIDRSFLQNLTQDTDDQMVAGILIELGRTLGMTVVAKGVETAEQLAFLQARGCDGIQGFLTGKPAPATEAAQWLRQPIWRF
ncbi:MAG: EAL domain-containing protein [Candidatus Competibacter sp.]|nr:EAL domain-containing protein [Candidatus Competibacter sp.]MDG4583558.1 EAL domain-containing protein [Candidatus Competibacter sp.]